MKLRKHIGESIELRRLVVANLQSSIDAIDMAKQANKRKDEELISVGYFTGKKSAFLDVLAMIDQRFQKPEGE